MPDEIALGSVVSGQDAVNSCGNVQKSTTFNLTEDT